MGKFRGSGTCRASWWSPWSSFLSSNPWLLWVPTSLPNSHLAMQIPSLFWVGRERGEPLGQCPILLGKSSTHSLHSTFPPWTKGSLLAFLELCYVGEGVTWIKWNWVFWPFTICQFSLCLAHLCAGLPDSHRGTLICGWLLKLCIVGK